MAMAAPVTRCHNHAWEWDGGHLARAWKELQCLQRASLATLIAMLCTEASWETPIFGWLLNTKEGRKTERKEREGVSARSFSKCYGSSPVLVDLRGGGTCKGKIDSR